MIQLVVLILATDILVCTIPNAIAYGYEKEIEVNGGALDYIVLTKSEFDKILAISNKMIDQVVSVAMLMECLMDILNKVLL